MFPMCMFSIKRKKHIDTTIKNLDLRDSSIYYESEYSKTIKAKLSDNFTVLQNCKYDIKLIYTLDNIVSSCILSSESIRYSNNIRECIKLYADQLEESCKTYLMKK